MDLGITLWWMQVIYQRLTKTLLNMQHIKAVPVVRKKSRTHYYTLLNKIDFGDMVPMEVCQV